MLPIRVAEEAAGDSIQDPDQKGVCADFKGRVEEISESRELSPRRLEAYRELGRQAERRGCLFAAAEAEAGVAVILIGNSRLARGEIHLDRSQELLEQWRRTGVGEDPQHPARVVDIEEVHHLHATNLSFRLAGLDQALLEYERAADFIIRPEGSPDRQVSVQIFGSRILRTLGRLEEAEKALDSVSHLVPRAKRGSQAGWHQERGWHAVSRGRPGKAIDLFKKALEVCPKNYKPHIFLDLADLEMRRAGGKGEHQKRRSGAKALKLIERADEAKGNSDQHLNAHLWHLSARAHQMLGDLAKARELAERALEVLEINRDVWSELGMTYISTRSRYFRHRLDIAFAQRDPQEMWEIFERWQARVLLRNISLEDHGGSSSSDPAPESRRQALDLGMNEALRRLNNWEPEFGEADEKARYAAYIEALSELRGFQARVTQEGRGKELTLDLTSPDEALELLDEGVMALNFLVGTESMVRLALRRGRSIEAATLELDPDRLQELLPRLVESWKSSSPDSVMEREEARLSAALFAGLDDLGDFASLILIGNGPLEGLPLDALPHPFLAGRLVRHHRVTYPPSFSVLSALRGLARQCSPPGLDVLALGDSIFGPEDPRWPRGLPSPRGRNDAFGLLRLPESGLEASRLKELFGEGATLLLGADATSTRLIEEAARHRIVHLATHADTHKSVPDRSRLTLSCLDGKDRVVESCDLYLRDISQLNLCGQTVVLSACSSAQGPQVVGEGVLGLPRAFLEVQASTVIATAWDIEDGPAAQLMEELYAHVSEGVDPSEALWLTRSEWAAAGRPIAQWAPFMAIGDWRSPWPVR